MGLNIDKLKGSRVYRDLKEEAEYTDEEIASWHEEEAFDKWLEWHGIIGYGSMILSGWKTLEEAGEA